jgi:segregation and condensation protein A
MILPREPLAAEDALPLHGDVDLPVSPPVGRARDREPSEDRPDASVPGPPGTSAVVFHLDRFEGPLDLLLYLIQRDEIDIYDIPIAHITKQYLAFLEVIDVFSLDNAGDFLVMAATLMRIKVRMLLPIQRPAEDEEDGDPRDELVRRLLEYKKFKEASEKLAAAEERRRDWYHRGTEFPYLEPDEQPAELSLSMFDLLSAVREIFDQLKAERRHHVRQEVFTVEDQGARILARLEGRESIRFAEIFAQARIKMEVVVTFVAMLELMKQGRLRARQVDAYGEIWLYSAVPVPAQAAADEPDTAPAAAEAQEGAIGTAPGATALVQEASHAS